MNDNTRLAEYYSTITGKKIELNEDGDIITDLTDEEMENIGDAICFDRGIQNRLRYE